MSLSLTELRATLESTHERRAGRLVRRSAAGPVDEAVAGLVRLVESGDETTAREARFWLWQLAAAEGVVPGSAGGLYAAVSRGELVGLTVPVVRLPFLPYTLARALLRAARSLDAGPVMLASACPADDDTARRAELAAVVLGAALSESFRLPVLLRGVGLGDAAGASAPQPSPARLAALAGDWIAEGFYNLDFGYSTPEFVVPALPALPEGIVPALGRRLGLGPTGEWPERDVTSEVVDLVWRLVADHAVWRERLFAAWRCCQQHGAGAAGQRERLRGELARLPQELADTWIAALQPDLVALFVRLGLGGTAGAMRRHALPWPTPLPESCLPFVEDD